MVESFTEWLAAEIASEPYWFQKIELQPGLATLEELLAGEQRFDFAFVDADKPNYIAYYEQLLRLVRRGGLICVDNTLFVAGTDIAHGDSGVARALRRFNDHVHRDERVDLALVPIGEGFEYSVPVS